MHKKTQTQKRTLASSRTLSIGKNVKKNVHLQLFEWTIFLPNLNFGGKSEKSKRVQKPRWATPER